MFVWLFHRISGVILVVLVGIKILTGHFLLTRETKPDWALSLHRQPVLDTLLLVLFTFHGVYGLRTVIIDLGCRKEKLVSRLSHLVASLTALALIAFYFKTA